MSRIINSEYKIDITEGEVERGPVLGAFIGARWLSARPVVYYRVTSSQLKTNDESNSVKLITKD